MDKCKFKPGDYIEVPCAGGTGNKDFGIVLLVTDEPISTAMIEVSNCYEEFDGKDYALTVLVDKLSDCESFQYTVTSSSVKYIRTLSLDELLTHENEFVRNIGTTSMKHGKER